jgi:NAD(P)-dependent dehydrogenase (short-subunit alcohol dehydrogenase family)
MASGSEFKGRIAVVTGGGRGIGAAAAHALAGAGAKVALVARTRSELETVAREINERFGAGTAWFEAVDVGDETQVRSLFKKIRKDLGPVDILINNAGIFVKAELENHSAEDWDRVFAVNVRGAFLCSREAFAHFKEGKRGGSIVNLSSLAGVRGTEKFPGLSSYVASKFAVVGLTEALAVEGRPHGIRVNCVAPGAVDTEMMRKAVPHLKTKTNPGDVAGTLLYLCDPARSGPVSGALIEIFSNE